MPLLSSAPRHVRVPLSGALGIGTYVFTKPVSKLIFQQMVTEVGQTQGTVRYSWGISSVADGNNYYTLLSDQEKTMDMGGGTPPPIFFKRQDDAVTGVIIMEIWE